MTKIFNAATLLLLAAESEAGGGISPSDPADEWLPGLELGPEITLELLLGHRSGIFNYTDDSAFLTLRTEEGWTPTRVVEWSLDHPAPYAPGEAYHYSNTGFFITGLAMEAATGSAFHEIVRAHTVAPLGLGDTSFEYGEGRDPNMALGYFLNAEVTDEIDMVWAWAAGGMVSSGVDICRFLEATYRGDLLPVDDRAAMLAESPESVVANGAMNGYGLGTRHTVRGGHEVVGHTGSTMGFRGEAFIDLETGVCVAVLTNSFTAAPTEISEPAWDAVSAAL